MLNQCTFLGRLTRTPELRHTGTGKAVISFTLAVDRDRPDRDGNWSADFVDLVAWDKMAEKVAKYEKGDLLYATGRWQNRPQTSQDGEKHTVVEISIEKCNRVIIRNRTAAAGALTPDEHNQGEEFAPLEDDDAQLPF